MNAFTLSADSGQLRFPSETLNVAVMNNSWCDVQAKIAILKIAVQHVYKCCCHNRTEETLLSL